MTYFSQQAVYDIPRKLVGFVAVNGISSFDLLSTFDAFAAATSTGPGGEYRRCYEPLIIGADRKAVVCSSGAVIKVRHTMQNAPRLDTIIMPGGIGLRNSEVARQITAWLRDRASTTRRIAAISAGVYPLASTGLLNGSAVTTHWRLAHEFACSFPALSVTSGASFIKAGSFFTCAGGIAGMEMSLALIEEDYGPATALAVARELSVDLRPPGATHQVALPQYQPGPTERLAELPSWITSRLHRKLTVNVLAERACLSPRHFYRLFKETFHSTPAAFIELLRINEAQRRLAARRENVESVATAVGFKSSAVFRRAFGRRHGVSPGTILRDSPEQTRPRPTEEG